MLDFLKWTQRYSPGENIIRLPEHAFQLREVKVKGSPVTALLADRYWLRPRAHD